jgi:hypothetical protein
LTWVAGALAVADGTDVVVVVVILGGRVCDDGYGIGERRRHERGVMGSGRCERGGEVVYM